MIVMLLTTALLYACDWH